MDDRRPKIQLRLAFPEEARSETPVKRVEISKPDGGIRKLGIPNVLDRFIQQAVLQVLQRYWDQTFSDSSYGFRPGRSAHQAITAAQSFIAEGFRWVVDLDLEKFFDRVNHDILMSRIAKRVRDVRVLQLIRAFLNAGVLEDDLDRELERRGLKFARYADDSNIYVRSVRAGQRVMASVNRFLTERLRLTVNASKSAVDRPWNRKFLGYSFTNRRTPKRRIAPKAIQRFKDRIRDVTRRTRGIDMNEMIGQLNSYLAGLAGLLWSVRNAERSERPEFLAPPPPSCGALEAMENESSPLCGTSLPPFVTRSRRSNGGFVPRPVASGEKPGTAHRHVHEVLPDPRPRYTHHPHPDRLTNRIAVYGPVRTVMWEGRSRKASPYPDV